VAKNIILIGMPGSGKSTIGVQLAKHFGLNFIDSDLLIQAHQGKTLQQILNDQGYQALRNIEEEELLKIQLQNDLLATGGSAVYSDRAMQHLKQQGDIVYLSVSFQEILKRIDNEDSRGIARPAGQSLQGVYRERVPLYERYADLSIDNEKQQPISEIAQKILSKSDKP
jgi:shikimate kinase